MRKILLITLFCILLVGCKTTKQKEIIDNVASFTPTELPETDSVYECKSFIDFKKSKFIYCWS